MNAAAAAAPESGVYLRAYLSPLSGMLARPDVTNIYVNRPGELWVETIGGAIERHDAPTLDEATLVRLARQIAALTHQGVNREHPLLSATLADGARIQIVGPPATRGTFALAICEHISPELRLSDYAAMGAFAQTKRRDGLERADTGPVLAALLEAGDIAGMLATAMRKRKNILLSGGTSTGKTAFLNALLREVPSEERLILIEDTPELQFSHPNVVGLLVPRNALGEAQIGAEDLVTARCAGGPTASSSANSGEWRPMPSSAR